MKHRVDLLLARYVYQAGIHDYTVTARHTYSKPVRCSDGQPDRYLIRQSDAQIISHADTQLQIRSYLGIYLVSQLDHRKTPIWRKIEGT